MEAELRAAREQGALQAARSEVSTLQAQVERLATDIDITVLYIRTSTTKKHFKQ